MVDRPKRPRRPRHRRDPDALDSPWPSSGRAHSCTECGTSAPWGDGWRWFGSQRDMDEGRPVLKLCSDECQQLYEEQHGKQQQTEGTEEEKPLVLRTPLIPSAFVVECPCCEQTNEVLTWEVQASGAYAAADEPNDICTIMTCTACGSILEPVAVAVTPAEQPA